jgi:polyisoprenoid-binding protein YceI
MVRGSMRIVSIVASVIIPSTAPSGNGPMELAIDAENSQVLIQVGKEGLFGFAGHAHEVAATAVHGRVTFDPSDLQHATVWLEFPAAALRVTGKAEPPDDVVEVQKVMLGERVLDVDRYPTIVFSSRRISVTARTAATADVVIDGDMTLHAVTRPMTVRASVTLDPGDRIAARGSFVLKQTDFGMVPVTAVGGTIRVRNELDIQFVLNTRPSDVTRTAR